MASLKFLVTNLIHATGVVLKNGTGGGAPALDEVSPHTMANVLKPGRRILWQQNSGSSMTLDLDMTGAASNVTARAGGIGAHRGIAGALTGVTSYTIKYSTHANGYPPGGGGSWTDVPGAIAVTVSSKRDKGVVFDSDITARYFRFDLTVGTVFTMGEPFLGVFGYDLGFLFSELVATPERPEFIDRTVGRDPVVNYHGDDRELWALSWSDIVNTHMDKIEAVRALRQPFWLADKSNVFRQFIVPGGRLQRRHKFEATSDTVYDPVSLELEQLG